MKKGWITLVLMCALLIAVPGRAAWGTESQEETTEAEHTEETKAPAKGKWIKKGKKYYYKKPNGKILKKKGMRKIDGTYYFLNKDHSRATGFKKSKGSYYLFQKKNGKRYEKTGWYTDKKTKKKYYFKSNHSLATGMTKIGKKKYYFNKSGVLQVNKSLFEYKDHYYRTNKKGVMVKVGDNEAEASIYTWKFIKKHSSSSLSNAKRFRACFNWLLAYMDYKYTPFNKKDFAPKDWQYRFAAKTMKTNKGDCIGFACSIASIAKELGYEPYVIVMTCDHAVVKINGKYYDNMGGGKFGASSPYITDYKIYKKVKF